MTDKNYIREKLSKDYNENILIKQRKYIMEKKDRIEKEQNRILLEQKRIELEEKEQRESRKKLMELQFNEYLRGLRERETKFQREFQEKLKPLNVTLPMKSDQDLRMYHDRIYKLADKSDLYKKLYMDYNDKAKNIRYYNSSSNYNHESFNNSNNNFDYNNVLEEYKKISSNKKTNQNNINNNDNNFYLKNRYRALYRQYDNFNKLLAEQNLRHKNFSNRQRSIEELKRIEERDNIYKYEKQEKEYENERKKEYREYLDKQVKEQFPIKLMNENFIKLNKYKNNNLYNSAPNILEFKKNKFVEVNPFCVKDYELGKSDLKVNPILNPMFNYHYNKYLYPKGDKKETTSMNDRYNKSNIL